MKLTIPLCVVCNAPLPPAGRRGPARQYCSNRCRSAARRGRARSFTYYGASPGEEPLEASEVAQFRSASTDEQVARAIIEAIGLVNSLRRLGRDARPNLRWRCARLAESLETALKRDFPFDY